MRGRNTLLLVSACAVCVTCGGVPAPRKALPGAGAVRSQGFGGWVVARRALGEVTGELIAVRDDSLWVLTQAGLRGLSRDSLVGAKVVLFDPNTGALSTWAAFGTLATIGNGAFLLFTAPAWLISAATSIPAAAKQAVYDWQPYMPLSGIAAYARFPAGIPPQLDRAALQLPLRMRK